MSTVAEKSEFKTINPSSGESLENFKYISMHNCEELLMSMNTAQKRWRDLSFGERGAALDTFAQKLSANKNEIAKSMTMEMGKPLKQSIAEIEKCVGLIEYCTKNVENILGFENKGSFVIHYQPLGIIYGIMPWNFPVWQSLRFAIPTLLAGNCVVLKSAECVTGTGQLLQKTVDEVPELKNIFASVIISHETSDAIIGSEYVQGVSLTGSSRAGSQVAAVAGKHIKKCVLELGGNDAYIVCEDADLDLAVEKVFQARLLNAGQSCISAKRAFVQKSVEAEFTKKLVEKIKAVRLKPPLDSDCDLGPIARIDLKDQLKEQVEKVLKDGGKCVYQQDLGHYKDQAAYFPITVLNNLSEENCVHKEELFGPVYSIIGFDAQEDVIRMANKSQYGLGGAIFSGDVKNAKNMALKVETGSLAINDFLRSTFERPFGGVKNSGYGRELGENGFFEFVNVKVIIGG
jgi:succinate-semialdehyde dehydrogenase / glutarate-semialdehyde dehydrogenase